MPGAGARWVTATFSDGIGMYFRMSFLEISDTVITRTARRAEGGTVFCKRKRSLGLNQSGPTKNETSWMVVMPFTASGLKVYWVCKIDAPALRAARGKATILHQRELR